MAEVFGPEQKKRLEELIRAAAAQETELARAERAGVDVADVRRRFREAQAKVARLKAVYLEGK